MPSEAQKKAGNYPMQHIRLHGLAISIENRTGSIRSGKDARGNPWAVKMPCRYGYIKRTTGADGDQIDVFVGPDLESRLVVITNQFFTSNFDEVKVMLGFKTLASAKAAYRRAFSGIPPHAEFKTITIERLKQWLAGGMTWSRFLFEGKLTGSSIDVKPTEFRAREEKPSTVRKVANVVAPLAITGGAFYLWHKTRPKIPTRVERPAGYFNPNAHAKPLGPAVPTQIKMKPTRRLLGALMLQPVIEFNDQNEAYNNMLGASDKLLTAYRKGRRAVPWLKRGSQVIGDSAQIAAGEKVKEPFYKKAWFRAAATGAALAAPIAISRKVNAWHHKELRFPGSTGKWRGKAVSAARAHAPFLTGDRPFFSAGHLPIIAFDVAADLKGWDVRDPRGRSARVYAPGSRRRDRREKTGLEKVSAIRAVRNIALIGAAGGLGGTLYYRNKLKKATAPKVPVTGNLTQDYFRNFKQTAMSASVRATEFKRKEEPALHRVVDAAAKNLPSRPEIPGENIARIVLEKPKARSTVLRLLGAGALAGGGTVGGLITRRPTAGALLGGLGAGLVLRG